MPARFLSFSLFFLLSCHSLSISADVSKLDEICNNVGGWYVTPQQCHTVLDTDPQSSTMNITGVGVIAASIAVKNATLVLANLARLLDNTPDPIHKTALQACVQGYTDIIPKLNSAAESIKAMKYREAEPVLNEALTVPAKCDDATADYPTIRALIDQDDVSFSFVLMVAHGVAGYLAKTTVFDLH